MQAFHFHHRVSTAASDAELWQRLQDWPPAAVANAQMMQATSPNSQLHVLGLRAGLLGYEIKQLMTKHHGELIRKQASINSCINFFQAMIYSNNA